MENAHFQKEKDKYALVEPSGSLDKPEGWLPRSIARLYRRDKASKTGVGVCLHFGPYAPQQEQALGQLHVTLPAASVSLVEVETVSQLQNRRRLHKMLFEAGWWNITGQSIARDVLVNSTVKTVKGTALTYFVDLLGLRTHAEIAQLVVEPMVKMYDGQLEYVADAALPVFRLREEDAAVEGQPQE
jgi:hypothetical protein